MTVDAISFDLGAPASVQFELPSSEGLAPLPLPDAIARFQSAMANDTGRQDLTRLTGLVDCSLETSAPAADAPAAATPAQPAAEVRDVACATPAFAPETPFVRSEALFRGTPEMAVPENPDAAVPVKPDAAVPEKPDAAVPEKSVTVGTAHLESRPHPPATRVVLVRDAAEAPEMPPPAEMSDPRVAAEPPVAAERPGTLEQPVRAEQPALPEQPVLPEQPAATQEAARTAVTTAEEPVPEKPAAAVPEQKTELPEPRPDARVVHPEVVTRTIAAEPRSEVAPDVEMARPASNAQIPVVAENKPVAPMERAPTGVVPAEGPIAPARPVVAEQPVVTEHPVVTARPVVAEQPVVTARLAAAEQPAVREGAAATASEDSTDPAVALPAAPVTPVVAPVEAQPAAQTAAVQSARTEVLAEAVGKTVEIVNRVVEAVVAEISVTPALAQGEGAIRITLKPTVLDGSEIRLTAGSGELTVSIAPATAAAAQIVQQNLSRLEIALAEHAPSFHHVAVAVASAKKGKVDETA